VQGSLRFFPILINYPDYYLSRRVKRGSLARFPPSLWLYKISEASRCSESPLPSLVHTVSKFRVSRCILPAAVKVMSFMGARALGETMRADWPLGPRIWRDFEGSIFHAEVSIRCSILSDKRRIGFWYNSSFYLATSLYNSKRIKTSL